MSAPLCPKMLHLLPSRYREHITSEGMASQHWDGEASEDACRCRGSECALWVPEVNNGASKATSSMTRFFIDQEGDRIDIQSEHCKATGRGWCSENLRRQPWTDPAADNDNTDGGGA